MDLFRQDLRQEKLPFAPQVHSIRTRLERFYGHWLYVLPEMNR